MADTCRGPPHAQTSIIALDGPKRDRQLLFAVKSLMLGFYVPGVPQQYREGGGTKPENENENAEQD